MLKLHAGVSNKVGLPGFSSASASCTIEAELDSSLLTDTAGFQIVVQRAYQSCEKAVQDQITRLTSDNLDESSQPHAQPQEVIEVRTSAAIRGVTVAANSAETPETNRAVFRDAPSPRPAVASSTSDSAGHTVLRAGRALSWPSRARAAVSVPPAMASGWHRQLRISSTASFPRCPCGSG